LVGLIKLLSLHKASSLNTADKEPSAILLSKPCSAQVSPFSALVVEPEA